MPGNVVFTIGRQQYCVSTMRVLEVSRMVLLGTSPDDQTGAISGMVTYRGRVVCVLDLHHRLRQPATAPLLQQSLIFVQAGPTVFALVADDVVEVAEFDDTGTPGVSGTPPVQRSFAIGPRLIMQLDIDWLADLCRAATGSTA